jgi:hypothetical protein
MTDLNTLIDPASPLAPYVTLEEGRDIADTGFIVANGVDSRTGETHAYLLTPPPQGISDCAHVGDAAPLVSAVFDRQVGAPDTFQASFEAPSAEAGVLCVDNGINGKPAVTAGSIDLNGISVVAPHDWKRGAKGDSIDVNVALLVENGLSVRLSGKPGAEIRIRVFAAAGGAGP